MSIRTLAWSLAAGALIPVVAVATGINPTYQPAPDYPVAEQAAGHGGTVLVRILVGDNGRVLEAKIVQGSGYPALDQAALKAVDRWILQPPDRGHGIEVVPITFTPPPDDVRLAMTTWKTATCERFLADLKLGEVAGKPAVETPLFAVVWSIEVPALLLDVRHLGPTGHDAAALVRGRQAVLERVRIDCAGHKERLFADAFVAAIADAR